jgi:hypothetical protein
MQCILLTKKNDFLIKAVLWHEKNTDMETPYLSIICNSALSWKYTKLNIF